MKLFFSFSLTGYLQKLFQICVYGDTHGQLADILKNIGPNGEDLNGVAPITVACWNARLEVVRALLEHEDIDVVVKDSSVRSPFHAAVMGLESECYPYPACKYNPNFKAERIAYFKPDYEPQDSQNYFEILKLLLALEDIDMNAKLAYDHPIVLAIVTHATLKVTRLLLESPKLDVNEIDCKYAEEMAIRQDHHHHLKLLAEYPEKFDMNHILANDLPLLAFSIKRKSTGCAKFLLDYQTANKGA